MTPRRLALTMAFVGLLLAGCGSFLMIHRFDFQWQRPLTADWQPEITVHIQGEDASYLWEQLDHAFAYAFGRLEGWGLYRESIDMYIYPDHDTMEEGTWQHGKSYMVGFGQYATVSLQSPRTWSKSRWQRHFREVMTHELTHIMMYQTACNRCWWFWCGIPLWFRGGLASYVADQGWRRGDRAGLREYYFSSHYVGDPLLDDEAVKRRNTSIVYRAGHWAFTDLVALCGKDRVAGIMTAMDHGADFDDAFKDTVGVGHQDYARLWQEDLQMGRNTVQYRRGQWCAP